MALDPAHPPIWLRKLHVAASQMCPDDYAETPEAGILEACRWSDTVHAWSVACARAAGLPPLPPRPPFENPFRPNPVIARQPSESRAGRAAS